jgi:mono/diheme cytochrome c family protein
MDTNKVGRNLLLLASAGVLALAGPWDAGGGHARQGPPDDERLEQVLRGRHLVLTRDCGACHGGGADPAAEGWLAGGVQQPAAGLALHTPNLTPDSETGIGRYTDRQIFNALRWGLRPGSTPDVEITSAAPGEGNHPREPVYLAPNMPWTSARHLTDQELWDIIAYLRDGVRPVGNALPENPHPEDGWRSWFDPEVVGGWPIVPFPAETEELRDPARREEVLRGRHLAASLGCAECHGGRGNPASPRWLRGSVMEDGAVATPAGDGALPDPAAPRHAPGVLGPYEVPFEVGDMTWYARNLTPDNVSGMGRFSERQIINALRFGLRPGETADVEVTSPVAGEGNHPVHPKYLAPAMPWLAWRHLSDQELRDLTAYLRYGLKPARAAIGESNGPPDFWAGFYAAEAPPLPVAPFPTAREWLRWRN